MSKKNILLISDLVGFGNLATTAMLPILSYMGMQTYNLPTALVSNNFGYGKYEMLDTTDYIRGVFPKWEELGFSFSDIATGFIPSEQQAKIISAYCKKQAEHGAIIFVDPVMGDMGTLYNGIGNAIIDCMREMLQVADLCFPNYTEACYLTDTPFRKEGVSEEEAIKMTEKIHALGSKSVIITSITIDGKPSVIGFNHTNGKHFIINYEEIPVMFSGTGDVFSAILIGHLLDGETLKNSTRKAVDGVYNLINLNKDAADPYHGIPVNKYLNIL